MCKLALTLVTLPLVLLVGAPAFAQQATTPATIPTACQTTDGQAGSAAAPADGTSTMGNMGNMATMDAPHAALMQGMDSMLQSMAMGSMVPNFDVAFVCSMLPHHLGAISMAQTELKYGKDAFARQLAQSIVDGQTEQVTAMKKWLDAQPKGP